MCAYVGEGYKKERTLCLVKCIVPVPSKSGSFQAGNFEGCEKALVREGTNCGCLHLYRQRAADHCRDLCQTEQCEVQVLEAAQANAEQGQTVVDKRLANPKIAQARLPRCLIQIEVCMFTVRRKIQWQINRHGVTFLSDLGFPPLDRCTVACLPTGLIEGVR